MMKSKIPDQSPSLIKKALLDICPESFVFFLSEDPSKVRMPKDRMNSSFLKSIVLTHDQFAQALYKRASDENERNKKLEMTIQTIKETLDMTAKGFLNFMDQIKKELDEGLTKIKESGSKTLILQRKLLSPNKMEDLGKMVDLVAASWKTEAFWGQTDEICSSFSKKIQTVLNKISNSLSETKSFESEVQGYKKDIIIDIYTRPNTMDQANGSWDSDTLSYSSSGSASQKNQSSPNKDEASKAPIKMTTRLSAGGLCLGNGGIAITSEENDRFIFLNRKGQLAEYNASFDNLKMIKEKETDFEASLCSFVEISPCGSMFLVGSLQENKLSVYDLKSSKEKTSWKVVKGMRKAKWVDSKTIVLALDNQDYLFLYDLKSSKSPYEHLQVGELSNEKPTDIDVYKNSKDYVCATEKSHVIFKSSLDKRQAKTIWKQDGHKTNILALKISQTRQFVISGSEDQMIILTRDSDGVQLACYSELTSIIGGICCLNNDKLLVVSTYHEVALLQVSNRGEITKMSSISKESFENGTVTGVNGIFTGRNQGGSYLIVGCYDGSIWRVNI